MNNKPEKPPIDKRESGGKDVKVSLQVMVDASGEVVSRSVTIIPDPIGMTMMPVPSK